MAQTQIASDFYSVEDYLALEAQATERSEYYNGEIFTMAGGTPNHNQISLNISSELHHALKKKDFRVYMADVKLWVPQRNSFLYPDVLVIKGEPELHDNSKDILLNPLAVIEVLSDSTKDYDRNGKFEQYRSLDSLQEYILVSQDKAHIEYFKKTAPHEWVFKEIDGMDALLELTTVEVALEIADIYDKVEFEQ